MTLSKVVKSYADYISNSVPFARQIVCGILFCACLVALILGYQLYNRHGNERAHQALAQAIELYERANREDKQNLWDDAELAFSQGYKEFSGSSLGAYFLAFQAEIAQSLGKVEQARTLFANALANLSKTSPLYNAYAIKLAIMKIDISDEQGHKELTALAGNPKNINRDMALYYQGLIEFDSGNRCDS